MFPALETEDWGATPGTRRGEPVGVSGWKEPDKGVGEDHINPNWPQPPETPDPLPQKLGGQLGKSVSGACL